MDRKFPLHKNRSRAGPSRLRRISRALREKTRALFSLIRDTVRVRKLRAELKAERAKSDGLESYVEYLQRRALEDNGVLEGYLQESTQLRRVIDEIVIPALTECDGRCGNGSCRLALLLEELPDPFDEVRLLETLQAEEP